MWTYSFLSLFFFGKYSMGIRLQVYKSSRRLDLSCHCKPYTWPCACCVSPSSCRTEAVATCERKPTSTPSPACRRRRRLPSSALLGLRRLLTPRPWVALRLCQVVAPPPPTDENSFFFFHFLVLLAYLDLGSFLLLPAMLLLVGTTVSSESSEEAVGLTVLTVRISGWRGWVNAGLVLGVKSWPWHCPAVKFPDWWCFDPFSVHVVLGFLSWFVILFRSTRGAVNLWSWRLVELVMGKVWFFRLVTY